jgi:hypothetical protein
MTVVLGQQFLQGVIIIADCRASWVQNGEIIARQDVAQKVFFLTPHLLIGFAGHIELAGELIRLLVQRVNERPHFGNIHQFYMHAPRFLRHHHKQKGGFKGDDVHFIVGGVDFRRPERCLDDMGKIKGFMPFYDRKVFKMESPSFVPIETDPIKKPAVVIGNGMEAFTEEIESDFKKLQFSFALAGSLALSGVTMGGLLYEKVRKVGIDEVGGMMQIAIIENTGWGVVPYKGRSYERSKNDSLDLETYMNDRGRIVQKNLLTGEEIELLFPPEVANIKKLEKKVFAKS